MESIFLWVVIPKSIKKLLKFQKIGKYFNIFVFFRKFFCQIEEPPLPLFQQSPRVVQQILSF